MRKRSSMRRLLSVVLALAMMLTLAVPALAAEQDTLDFEKVDNIFGAKLSALQEAQLNEYDNERNPEDEVRVSIVLEKKGTIPAGFASQGIAANSEAMAYRDALKREQAEMTATIESTLGGQLDVVWNLTLAANIISANIKYGQMKVIREIPGVVAVFEEAVYQPEEPVENGEADPNMKQSRTQIGSEIAWQAGYTGAGTRVAIIDTGLDYQHEAFSADAFEYSLNRRGGSVDLMTASDIQSVLAQLNVYTRRSCSASQLYFNSKVPFGYNYAEDNFSISHSYEAGEHGSHVAGIAAANKYVKVGSSYYEALNRSGVQGVAPDAQILVMNVFGDSSGCYSSDYMAAIEDAVILGADSVNLSLGSGNPGFACSYVYEDILNNLIDSGVVVAMSAGNSGHWYDADINGVPYLYLDDVGTHTGGSPGTYTNSLCVASVDSANANTASYYTISSFSSWGVPGSLTMKPEISAPGGQINSVAGYVPYYITNHTSYEYMSGTSMASPQVAGMAAVVAQYIRENGLENKTGLDARTLAQSLLMSTAEPMYDSSGRYYPILRQGAGMGHVGNAVTADSFILMGEDATASWADGKVKAELGDDPNRTGTYTFTFTIHNITNSAKTYYLSAEVFTQNYRTQSGEYYMDRATKTLEADVTFGAPGSGGRNNRDFDGDGDVDTDDGKYLLAFVAGAVDAIANEDQADISGNGRITSYDAYLFFTTTEGVTAADSVQVPANGSVDVEVTISLTSAQKQTLNQYYEAGAYIQAYVYAESSSTSHSIPVLGFYGNWSDPSMFDKGDAMAFYHEEETRTPYLYDDLSKMNTVMYTNEAGNTYHLGGNPAVKDPQYYPERNAINSQTERIYGVGWTPIRNAGESYAIVRNTQNNTFYTKNLMEQDGVIASFYYVNAGSWYNHWFEETGLWNLTGIPENTPLEVGIALVPEYYTLRDSYSFDELGDGAFLTVPVTIDNTDPTMNSYALIDNDSVLQIDAKDNQYVAAVALLDSTGRMLTYTGSLENAQKGQSGNYDLDVSSINGSQFYIQIYDYAGNISLYQVEIQLGSVVEYVTGVTLSDYTTSLRVGETYTFVADVQPENASNRNVTWSSSNTNVATISSTGVVTAVGSGTTTIKATSVLDPSYYATCTLTVSAAGSGTYISGLLNNSSGTTVLYNLDVDGASWSTAKTGPNYTYTSAVQIPGTNDLYALDYSYYTLDKINASTGAFETVASDVGRPLSDITYSSHFSTSSNPRIHAIADCLIYPNNSPTSFSTGTYFDFESIMYSRTGATYLLALTSLGSTTYNSTSTEHLIALDNRGYLWDFWVYPKDGGYSCWYEYTRSDLTSAGAKLGGRLDENDNFHSWHSMEVAPDGTLYLMAYYWNTSGSTTTRRVELYTIKYTGSSYDATYMGHMGQDVYPVNITSITTGSGIYSAEAQENRQWPEPKYQLDSVTVAEGQKTGRFAMALDYAELDAVNAGPAAGAAATATEEKPETVLNFAGEAVTGTEVKPNADDTVQIELYAKDANGNPIAQTNGMFQVMYDPSQLTLDMEASVMYNTAYFAVHDDGYGVVTIAFVGPNRMNANQLLSTIVFENHASQNTPVYILHCDYNDADSGYLETHAVEPAVTLVEWIQLAAALEGKIGLNFYVKLADSLVDDSSTYMYFSFDGESFEVPLSEAVVIGDQYRFTFSINAKNMADTVTAQVMTDDGPVGDAKNLTVMAYCNYQIQNSRNANLVKLMKAMLNYGAAAQIMFNHNTDNLANASLSDADKVLADVDASAYAHSVTGSEDGIQVYNATLVLETGTSIRIYFTLTGSKPINRYTFRVDGVPVQPQMNGSQYFVEVPAIAAQDLDDMHTITVGGITVKYGGLSYVNQVMQNQANLSEVTVNAAKAIYAYNKLAEAYFNQ